MAADITVQYISTEPCVPAESDILHWAVSALASGDDRGDGSGDHGGSDRGDVNIRITDADEMQSLNNKWRNIDEPTNVLSFPLREAGCPLLGDVVICAPVVIREAAQQAKSTDAHWAHMIIHGILHLIGYDHSEDQEADIMEAKEIALMQELGFPDPYHSGLTTGDAKTD